MYCVRHTLPMAVLTGQPFESAVHQQPAFSQGYAAACGLSVMEAGSGMSNSTLAGIGMSASGLFGYALKTCWQKYP